MVNKQPKRKARQGVDEYGRTPLHSAALKGDEHAILTLLSSGSDINTQDDDGFTPLHFATQSSHHGIVEVLLQRGANPNLLNSHGNGPLWTAVMNARGNFVSVKKLLDAGANPDQKNTHGRSPRDMAQTIKCGLDDFFPPPKAC